MIYTVGNTVNYQAAIKEHGEVLKQGQTTEYEGGIVFERYIDAVGYLSDINKSDVWSVWGVDADWIMDTYPASDGWWSYLLFDAPIIPLE